ncbi:hypothetical protein APHAL10511_000263 [Amanita phalloides]|nr:hypothetical protein APHAL10511_000263 [Amanita phalloides]
MPSSFEIKPPSGSGSAVIGGDLALSLTKRKRMGDRDASSAAGGPGPSTVAAQARNGRKYAAIMPVIELTDSESDEGSKPHSERASNSNSTKPLSGVATHPPSMAESTTWGDKGKVKEAVPLFMDSDGDSVQAIQSLTELSKSSNFVHPWDIARGRMLSGPGDADQPTRTIATDKSAQAADEGRAAAQPELVPSQQGNANETTSEEDIVSLYVAQVLEIVPDVAPDYLLALIKQLHPHRKDDLINTAIQMLFEDTQYPKVERRGKRKSAEPDARIVKKAKLDYVDYSQRDRPCLGGPNYTELSLGHLQTAFPYVPKAHVRKVLIDHNSLYAPSHMHLKDLFKRHNLLPNARPPLHITGFPFFALKRPFKPQAKTIVKDTEFEKERQWIVAFDEEDGDLAKVRARFGVTDEASKDDDDGSKGKGKATDEDEDECPEGEGIECNCCFTEYLFETMIQCPEAHLFCKSCVINYASNQLGIHDIRLKCMDQSGCSFLFPDFELRRVLPQKLIDLYDRLKQQKEIEEADLEGLEECPFCDYKCVMDVDMTQEKLFRCGNYDGGCGAISCRECKRLDHLPKSCKEMDEERVLNQQHTVEEAMSAALMRTCPKCQKTFIKESGCNKITCYTCHTVSCYICRKIINGYDHFNNHNQPNAASSSEASAKCPLWDPSSIDVRHAQEVKEAAEKALADLKSKNPHIDANSIKVDLPDAKQPPKPRLELHFPALAIPPAPNPGHRANQPARPQVPVIGNPGQPPPIQPRHYLVEPPPPLPLPPYRVPPLPVQRDQRGAANVNVNRVQRPARRRR